MYCSARVRTPGSRERAIFREIPERNGAPRIHLGEGFLRAPVRARGGKCPLPSQRSPLSFARRHFPTTGAYMRVRAYLRECAPPRYAQSSLSLFLPRPFTGEREEGGNRLDGPYSFAPFPRSEREKENFICSARREALPGFFPLAPAVFSGFLSPFFFALIAWNAERTDCIYIYHLSAYPSVFFFSFSSSSSLGERVD